jgi:adenosylmethionine-8-amino-7-oxononanoate aminotransferase
MTYVMHRKLTSVPPVAVRGEGVYLFDSNGKRYLDASGGAAVACLGHSHPAVINAVVAQLQSLPCAHTSFFTSEAGEALAEFMVRRAPAGIARFVTVSDGSVAIETALKLARQYWVESGQPQRRYVISRQQSYHGNTLGALSVSGNPHRRLPYAPLLSNSVAQIEPCYAYRYQHADETLDEYGVRSANLLEQEILRLGAENVGAFIAETVAGATLGCVPPAPGYFRRIREICDQYGVLLILDEVMCGMGRTGTLFACEREGISPDLMTVAKGLAGGYQPVGGVLVGERIVDMILGGSGALANGHTYMGHSAACAAALAVQRVIEDEHLLERVNQLGTMFEQKLRLRFEGHPHVGDIRGRGLFWAMELVADRGTKASFPQSVKLHERIKQAAQQRGLICYPSGGTADGVHGDHILFAPPYTVSEQQLDDIVEICSQSLDHALSEMANSLSH